MQPELREEPEPIESVHTALDTASRFSADRLQGSSFGALGYTSRRGLSKSVFTVAVRGSIEVCVEQSQSENQLYAFSFSRMVLLLGTRMHRV